MSALRQTALGLTIGGLALFGIAQAVPWGTAEVNVLFFSVDLDLYSWGIHSQLSGPDESEDDWANWYTGGAEVVDEEEDADALVVTNDYSTAYFSDSQATVSASLELRSAEWRAGKEQGGMVAFVWDAGREVNTVAIDAWWVNATDADGQSHVLHSSSTTVDLADVADREEVSFTFTPQAWPGPVEVGIEARMVAKVAETAGSPVSAQDTASYTEYDENFDDQTAGIRVTTSSANDIWFVGRPYTVDVAIELIEATRIVAVDVTRLDLEADSSVVRTDATAHALVQVGDRATYSFSFTPTNTDSVRFEGQPALHVSYADGSERSVPISQNGIFLGDITVDVRSPSEILEGDFFPSTVTADFASEDGSAAGWAWVMRTSHPVQVIGLVLGLVAAALFRQRTAGLAQLVMLIASTAVLAVSILMFTVGFDQSGGDDLGAIFDWSWGLFLGVLGLLTLIAACILLGIRRSQPPGQPHAGPPAHQAAWSPGEQSDLRGQP